MTDMIAIYPPQHRGVRQQDKYGAGHFGAPRKRDCVMCTPASKVGCQTCGGAGEIHYEHKGLDLVSAPLDPVFGPFDEGLVVRSWGLAYPTDVRYHTMHIRRVFDSRAVYYRAFYLTPASQSRYWKCRAGEVIGHAEDLTLRYPGITNHIHIELRIDGVLVDPAPYLMKTETT